MCDTNRDGRVDKGELQEMMASLIRWESWWEVDYFQNTNWLFTPLNYYSLAKTERVLPEEVTQVTESMFDEAGLSNKKVRPDIDSMFLNFEEKFVLKTMLLSFPLKICCSGWTTMTLRPWCYSWTTVTFQPSVLTSKAPSWTFSTSPSPTITTCWKSSPLCQLGNRHSPQWYLHKRANSAFENLVAGRLQMCGGPTKCVENGKPWQRSLKAIGSTFSIWPFFMSPPPSSL